MECLFITGGLAHDQFGTIRQNPNPEYCTPGWRRVERDPLYSMGQLT